MPDELKHADAFTLLPLPCVYVCVFQELTEEGIPFLILFHVKEDTESLEKFQHEVARQLISEKGSVFVLKVCCGPITWGNKRVCHRVQCWDHCYSLSYSLFICVVFSSQPGTELHYIC